MTPYGYHNSEPHHSSGDERRNAREAIRQAKLVRQQTAEAENSDSNPLATPPALWTRLLNIVPHFYLRLLRGQTH